VIRLIRLQIHRSRHSYLCVNDICNEVLNDLVARIDQALLEIDHVEEQDVKGCWQDCRHVREPVPEDHVEVIL